jgi:hypothetical protein
MKKITLVVFFSCCVQMAFAQREKISNNILKKERIALNPIANFNKSGDEVWLFERENFEGKKLVLKVGTYTLQQMGTEWNDRISSALLPEGYQMQIFAEDKFKGVTIDLNGYWQMGTSMQRWRNDGYSQLKIIPNISYDFNDKISSIQIYKLN